MSGTVAWWGRRVRSGGLAMCMAVAVFCGVSPSGAAPQSLPITAGGRRISAAELNARAAAFSHGQALQLSTSRAYVAREAIDERWALHDAQSAGVAPNDAAVDAALARAARGSTLEQLSTYYGMTGPQLRQRVRGEMSARALADRALRLAGSDAEFGRFFALRDARRRTHTHCESPFAPLDRCRGGHNHDGERSRLLGVGLLHGRGAAHYLELDLAPLLAITSSAGDDRAYAAAERRLQSAITRRSAALAQQVRLGHDSYAVTVNGPLTSLVSVARLAGHLALHHSTPVLL